MNFCKNCGQKTNLGEQFCSNCGASVLENNDLNSISKKVKKIRNSHFTVYITEILEITKGILTKPVTTIVNCDAFLKKESCGILVLVLSVLFGLLNMWAIKMSTSVADELFAGLRNSIHGSDGLLGQMSQFISGDIASDRVFFITSFLFIVAALILFASNYLIGKYIFKSSVKASIILKVISCSAIPFIFALLLSIILSYISSTLGFIVLFIGTIATLIILFRGITEALNISEEITIFIIPISLLVMLWVEYMVIIKILKNILSNI
ncbi:zinc ribbon domain-containing protein [Clostridium lacusfryxellense]|uniref:zinc ribbon domain-containing protein n=1 Tax=Clostridium lacusfryxellense TaxID=205328 RepID=UPI001C0CAE70|nr:zinc ribbon domain-containing protein [Clostridium lacusfryxellense]MBU3113831.1 zinc ribbon domain-containing protein [Clostridium lacusfryxellense]